MNLAWLIFMTQLLARGKVEAQETMTGYCAKDEVCRHIPQCAEFEYVRSRNFAALRQMTICGAYLDTDELCCKLEIPEDLKNPPVPAVSTGTPIHENFYKINHKSCGASSAFRVVGGEHAKMREFPWMALLLYRDVIERDKKTLSFKCGGSLITEKHVLTAAHCLTETNYELVSVRLGEHKISTPIDCDMPKLNNTCFYSKPVIQDIEPLRTAIHEQYDPAKKVHDIALITLKKNVYFHPSPELTNVGTICLPVNEKHTTDHLKDEAGGKLKMVIAGWGYTNKSAVMSDVLQSAIVSFLEYENCSSRYSKMRSETQNFKQVVDVTHLCAGGEAIVDTCKGDSGGPLMALADHLGRDRMFLLGIVSSGVRCSLLRPVPGLYTKVEPYIEWILNNLTD